MPLTSIYHDLDPIESTPAKARGPGPFSNDMKGYNSQDDSGSEIFDHDTLATLPLERPIARSSSPLQPITQPTQPLGPSIVQVLASSPPPEKRPSPPMRASFASSIAPPGTSFRRPFAQPPKHVSEIELSDDELDRPNNHLFSSEDELSQSRSDIPKSTFAPGGRSQVHGSQARSARDSLISRLLPANLSRSNSGNSQSSLSQRNSENFKVFAEQWRHDNDQSNSRKRPVDDTAGTHADSRRRQKQPRQTGPAKAQPVEPELDIDHIPDFDVRNKLRRMQKILSQTSARTLLDALYAKRGNVDDALAHVAELEEKGQTMVDLTVSDSEGFPGKYGRPAVTLQPLAKREIKSQFKSIRDKYSTTQHQTRKPAHVPSSSPPPSPPKPTRRRLVTRKRAPSASDLASPSHVLPSRPKQKTIVIESDDDSAAEDEESEVEDHDSEARLFKFFKSCTPRELADLCNFTEEECKTVLDSRPFNSLNDVRQVSIEVTSTTKTGKRSTRKKLIGDKVVDVCLEMWAGYEAVDQLVSQCEALGKPIAAEMRKWGIDVSGVKKGGELAIVSLDNVKSEGVVARDSGIGTPTSSREEEEDLEGSVTRATSTRSSKPIMLQKPAIMSEDLELKDYQVVGLNWLNLLWSKKLSCILADDMGLGKTCQVITFLSHLHETGETGPHLIVVPGSTLENWLREFQRFSPSLVVEPYYGSQAERREQRAMIDADIDVINVIVTTYDIAMSIKGQDNDFLRSLKISSCIFDEGHMLKNSTSLRYKNLMRIKADFRLLLTGTPLQNNLIELASLLSFLMPEVFKDCKDDLAYIFKHNVKTTDSDHGALLSAQRIARARSIIAPFILRRKKTQVLKHMPKKTRRVEYCELLPEQKVIYDEHKTGQQLVIAERADGKVATKPTNWMSLLRKGAIHPLLFRRIFDDAKIAKMARDCLNEEALHDRNENLVREDMSVMTDFELHHLCNQYPKTLGKYALKNKEWLDSGKVRKLSAILQQYVANGDRTLVFSQFTTVLDILESVLNTLNIPFMRLDGKTAISQRQEHLDQFYEDESIKVFMLSTKAGGTGINLAAANKVIIFDSSFNPQDDIQAENRAHRVGQTREVEVVRLVTRGTIEEQIYALGESKLKLGEEVAGEHITKEGDGKAEAVEKKGEEMVKAMLMQEIDGCAPKKGDDVKKEDLKDEFLTGLKAAGLDMSAA